MGKRKQTIYVDRNLSQTAADIVELSHCEALIKRHERDIASLKEKGAQEESAPRHVRQALFFNNQALRELAKRRMQLLA